MSILFALTTVVLSSAGYFIWKSGLPLATACVIEKNYNKYKKYKQLLSIRYTCITHIWWYGSCLLVNIAWCRFKQTVMSNIKKISRRKWVLSYTINGELYKIIIHKKSGPFPIILAIDEDGNDITDMVIPYVGANNDFHRCHITPKYFNKKEITFETADGESIRFKENAKLELN